MMVVTRESPPYSEHVIWEAATTTDGESKEIVARFEIREAPTDSTKDSDGSMIDLRLLPGNLDSSSLMDDDEDILYKSDGDRATKLMKVSLCVLLIGIIALVVGVTLQITSMRSCSQIASGEGTGEIQMTQDTPDLSWDEDLPCNGAVSNCDLVVNDIMYATANYAMSSEKNGFYPFHHLMDLEDAMQAGFRGFVLSTCNCPRVGVQLCLPGCEEGYRRSIVVFQAIVHFLEQNPGEVIIVSLEVHDSNLITLFDELSLGVQGLTSLMYKHPDIKTEWPTLRDLVQENKRLIIFQDGDEHNCAVPGECPEGVLNKWAYMFSTRSDASTLHELFDFEVSCTAIRGYPTKAAFFVLNHYLSSPHELPNPNVASTVNQQVNLKRRLDVCGEHHGRTVNMVVVNFWSFGDTVSVVNELNRGLVGQGGE